jgi:hypothetical protein
VDVPGSLRAAGWMICRVCNSASVDSSTCRACRLGWFGPFPLEMRVRRPIGYVAMNPSRLHFVCGRVVVGVCVVVGAVDGGAGSTSESSAPVHDRNDCRRRSSAGSPRRDRRGRSRDIERNWVASCGYRNPSGRVEPHLCQSHRHHGRASGTARSTRITHRSQVVCSRPSCRRPPQ